jgi:ABC-type bacteriocin/lantibiotic exporter with double-glycine peptidase domain
MDFRSGQQPGFVPDKGAEGRRFVAVGVILIGGSMPFLALVVTFLGKRLGTLAWVIVAAMLLDIVLGISFIAVGRKKMKQQQPGWEQTPSNWGKG